MKASEMFKGKFLKAADIGQTRPIVTIDVIAVEEVGEEKKPMPILSFAGKDKRLVCNVTNWNTLTDLFGEETDEWLGKKIRLLTEETTYGGKRVMAVRISCQPVDFIVKAAARSSKPEVTRTVARTAQQIVEQEPPADLGKMDAEAPGDDDIPF
jgi:hypothetical protein